MRIPKALAAALAVAVAVASGPAMASPAWWVEYDYYADASMTTLVGNGGMTCTGLQYLTGEKTLFRVEVFRYRCNNEEGIPF